MEKEVKGIPDRASYGDTSKIPLNTLLTYVDQLHEARRAGTHHDIRFGDRELFSWAGRRGLPAAGERAGLFQQPLHSPEYANFEGEIPEGYGAGRVTTHDRGNATVTEAGPDKIKFTLTHKEPPEHYTMIRTGGKGNPWLAINQSQTKQANLVVTHNVHGDEPAGEIAAKKLEDQGIERLDAGNHTGKRRYCGVDLNRHFDKSKTTSQNKKILEKLRAKKPTLLVDLHEDSDAAGAYAYTTPELKNYVKGLLKRRNSKLPTALEADGDRTDEGVITDGKHPGPGALVSAARREGIPYILLETPSNKVPLKDRADYQRQVVEEVHQDMKRAAADFAPDYTPEDLRRMGVYEEVYDRTKPRLASLNSWPQHWFHPEDKMGWLEWYEKYNAGRRMEDDERQIKRWKAFKARHGGQAFQENPTPRRAYALRNWGIDPVKLLNQGENQVKLKESMRAYRDKKYEKAACDWLGYLNKLSGESPPALQRGAVDTGEPLKKEKEHPILRALLANAVGKSALLPTGLLAAGATMKMPGTGGEELSKKHLENLLQNSGIPKGRQPKIHWSGTPSFSDLHGENKFLKSMSTNAVYDPATNVVSTMGNGKLSPGLLAHELGHAQIQHGGNRLAHWLQNRGRGMSTVFGPLASLIATQGVVDDNDSNLMGAGKGALAGATAWAPMLLNEIDASRRGMATLLRSNLPAKYKLMNSLAMLPAFASYGTTAAGVPAIFGALTARAKRKVKEKNQKNEKVACAWSGYLEKLVSKNTDNGILSYV